jgi:hypothetical protein
MDATFSTPNLSDVEAAAGKLLAYCQANDFSGYDPYDALNSKIFLKLPVLNSRIPRLFLTQALKRSPINVRPLLLVPKTQNPKALALFLSACLNLVRIGHRDVEKNIPLLIDRISALQSAGERYACWGYSFPWQTRTLVVPKGAPNLVCTAFVGSALLDAYEQGHGSACLQLAVGAAEYIVNQLYWTEGDATAGFSYPVPLLRGHVPNANFLGAALLCQVYRHTGDDKFLAPALRVARYSAASQQADGSWSYGKSSTQRWIDNFHTGYNLCALRSIGRFAQTEEFETRIRRGFEFYRSHFFREDGAPRYFHDRTYPIDIHCVAQSIITLIALRDLDPGNVSLARSVFNWAMRHMWDPRGFFYYRVLRTCTIKASYMRWSQAWMLLALSTMLSENELDSSASDHQDAKVVSRVS